MDFVQKVKAYRDLLVSGDRKVADFVRQNESDREFMTFIKLHVALATGLMEVARERQEGS